MVSFLQSFKNRSSLVRLVASQVLRPTSYGKWVGGPMSLKGGNFSFQARTDQNQPRMDKYGTYLDFNASQGAPKHCPTLDSLTQCFASAHFRSPPGASGSLREPPILFATIFHLWFLSNSETIFLQQWNHISETHLLHVNNIVDQKSGLIHCSVGYFCRYTAVSTWTIWHWLGEGAVRDVHNIVNCSPVS